MDKPAKMQNLVTGTDKWTWEKAWMILFFLCFLTEKCHSSLQDVRSATKIGDSLTFLVVGDWGRKGLYNQTEVAAEMGRIGENLGIDFVISTGDNFYDNGLSGTEDPNFEESFSRIYTAKSLQIPWYSVLGNHDYQGDALAQLSPALRRRDPRWNCGRSFVLKYNICPHKSAKSKECGTVDFFFVDTTPFVDMYWKQSNKKYDWRGVIPRKKYLKQQLQDLALALNASTARWKVMIGHHPIRSIGAHGDTDELVHHLLPLVKGYGVIMYLNGHDHCVEDLISDDGGLQFLTSGGGSKAWRGLKKGTNVSTYLSRKGLQFEIFHDGQGFISVQVQAESLHTNFHKLQDPFN